MPRSLPGGSRDAQGLKLLDRSLVAPLLSHRQSASQHGLGGAPTDGAHGECLAEEAGDVLGERASPKKALGTIKKIAPLLRGCGALAPLLIPLLGQSPQVRALLRVQLGPLSLEGCQGFLCGRSLGWWWW